MSFPSKGPVGFQVWFNQEIRLQLFKIYIWPPRTSRSQNGLSFFLIIGLLFKKTQPKTKRQKTPPLRQNHNFPFAFARDSSKRVPKLGGLNSYNWRIYGIHGIWAIYTIQSLTSLNVSAILLRNPLLNYTFWGDQPAGKVVVNCPDGMKIMKNQPFIVGTSLMDIG